MLCPDGTSEVDCLAGRGGTDRGSPGGGATEILARRGIAVTGIEVVPNRSEERRGTEAWTKTQENVIDIMKKSLGIMVFEAICTEMDFSDETIQKIQGQ